MALGAGEGSKNGVAPRENTKVKTVLVSVTDKTGLDRFLKRLERFDELKLIGTTSTHKFLTDNKFACTKVEELTNFPEILSGRVKTLHPRVFAGILARPSKEDRDCLSEMDIQEIDLVIVNLYAFEKKLSEGLPEAKMIEEIDVGGVALLRAAAKNFERVAVISSPDQYDMVIEELDASGGKFTLELRRKLAYAALARTAAYDASISAYLHEQVEKNSCDKCDHTNFAMPESVSFNLVKYQDLRYGENPHQAAAWYSPMGKDAWKVPFLQLQGKDMSSNNIIDTYCLLRYLREFEEPVACLIKHNNPCGIALGKNIDEAFDKAYACDPLSAFGGVFGFNGTVGGKLATKITENFVEIVLAPEFDKEAMDIFSKKKNIRVLKLNPEAKSQIGARPWHVRDLKDVGVLVEQDMEAPVKAADFKCVTEKKLDAGYETDIAFTWSIVKHLTSNAIFVARHALSLGFGIGQTSRIASVNHALTQAGANAKGAVLASDAFFPATDNIESAAKAGISVIIQPGGSIKDDEVIAACNKAGIVMLFTGQRCFRH